MPLLSDDDENLKEMTEAELGAAFDLWFELAATTDADDPAYTHGVFQNVDLDALRHEVDQRP
jgi:hypothetical protein